MNKTWITKEEMVKNLKRDPDNVHEYSHHLGGVLYSTHWYVYNSKMRLFGHSDNLNDYDWYTEEEMLEFYNWGLWRRDA